jgi:hypothetical protein
VAADLREDLAERVRHAAVLEADVLKTREQAVILREAAATLRQEVSNKREQAAQRRQWLAHQRQPAQAARRESGAGARRRIDLGSAHPSAARSAPGAGRTDCPTRPDRGHDMSTHLTLLTPGPTPLANAIANETVRDSLDNDRRAGHRRRGEAS